MPAHAVISKVCQRVPQGGELPVQHANHACIGGMKHQIVQTVVTVHNRSQVTVRDVLWQPVDQVA